MPTTAGHDNPAEQEERDTQLTEDEVLQILDLVEKSNFDYLDLEIGDLKLTVSKSGIPVMPATASVAQAAPAAAPRQPRLQLRPPRPRAPRLPSR